MKQYKIILLACEGDSTCIAYHKINQQFDIAQVILEEKISTRKIIQRKIKKHGYLNAIGQILFQLAIPKILRASSKKRIEQIHRDYQLNKSPIPENKIMRIGSVNDADCIQHLLTMKPDLIIVNGTRIISNKLISSVNCPLINIHVGITPKYRGVHGGYWSVWNEDTKLFGVTVHFIDAGVDTGKIIAQKIISFTSIDNFITYPILQQANGLELLLDAIKCHFDNQHKDTIALTEESKQWYHPTLWQYIWARATRGIK